MWRHLPQLPLFLYMRLFFWKTEIEIITDEAETITYGSKSNRMEICPAKLLSFFCSVMLFRENIEIN